MPARERFRLLVEVSTAGVPAAVTLRRALKCLLRGFGVRCISVVSADPKPAETKPDYGDKQGAKREG